MEIDAAIGRAIEEAVRAGVFWRAARLNPKARKTWEGFAELHHDEAAAALAIVASRVGAGDAGSRP
jgi:hypothetical protein